MKTHPTSRTIVAALVAVLLAGSGSAWADRKNDQRSYGHGQGSHQDKRANDRARSGHHDKRSYVRDRRDYHDKYYTYNKQRKNRHERRHYRDSHKPDYYRGRGVNSYYYEDDDNDDDLLMGLLLGGLFGYVINNGQY